jgi:predicted small secreted protein
MKDNLRYLMLVAVAILALGSLSACRNTLDGAGEDVENMGENMQEASQN